MTKVVARFRLQSPLSERHLTRLAELRGVYGILGFDVDEANNRLAVEYDATRLKPEEVGGLLRASGLPALLER